MYIQILGLCGDIAATRVEISLSPSNSERIQFAFFGPNSVLSFFKDRTTINFVRIGEETQRENSIEFVGDPIPNRGGVPGEIFFHPVLKFPKEALKKYE